MCCVRCKATALTTPATSRYAASAQLGKTYDIKQSFHLVLADLMGPMSPPALGGFQHVSKFVDQQTKWKEIFLIKAKSDAVDTLELFNQSLVIPTGL